MARDQLILTHLRTKDYARQAWKNGKGSTQEIARGKGDPFPWRLSWAAVPESCPFSTYPGYDRSLTLLSGGPLNLSHDGKPPRQLVALQPHSFHGEATTQAIVEAAAEDFNLFTLREATRGSVYPAWLKEGEELQFSVQRHEHFFFCLEGSVEILDPNSNRQFQLTSGDTLWASRDTAKEFLNLRATCQGGSAIGLWVVVSHLG